MKPYILLFLSLFSGQIKAQPYYTKLRAAFSLEVLGFAPVAMFSPEIAFAYKARSFWNAQAGLGFTGAYGALTPSVSSAVTHNFLLNRYRRSQCSPAPDYNHFESYLETGLALSVFDPYYGGLPRSLYKDTSFTPSALLGVRFHCVRERWICILKLHLSPILDREFAAWGGIGLGLGWR